MPVASPASSSVTLPLLRRGRWYASLDRAPEIAGLSLAPPVLLRDDLRWFRASAPRRPDRPDRPERGRIVARAVERFASGTVEIDGLGVQGPADLERDLDRHCGLPPALTRRWAGLLGKDLTPPDLPPGTLALVSLPANTFVCLEAALDFALRGAAVWLRPSRREPFTALRLAACLLAEGWPEAMLGVYPTPRSALSLLVRGVDLAVLYGGEELEAELGALPNAEVRGPGRARAVVAADCPVPDAAAALLGLVAGDAGRFCTNVGTILCERSAEEIGRELAGRLDGLALDDPDWPLAAWPDEGPARATVAWIEGRLQEGDRFLTRRLLLQRSGGRAVLAPSLVALARPDEHPLLGVELPFPFAVLIDSPDGPRPDLLHGARFVHRIGAAA